MLISNAQCDAGLRSKRLSENDVPFSLRSAESRLDQLSGPAKEYYVLCSKVQATKVKPVPVQLLSMYTAVCTETVSVQSNTS